MIRKRLKEKEMNNQERKGEFWKRKINRRDAHGSIEKKTKCPHKQRANLFYELQKGESD